MLLVSLWLKPEADKDKDSYAKNFIGYCIDAATFEERAEYNPFDLFNQIKSPSAAIAPVENVINVIKLFDPIHFENNFMKQLSLEDNGNFKMKFDEPDDLISKIRKTVKIKKEEKITLFIFK